MNPLAVESERQLLSCLDEVLDAPAAERHDLVRSRFGADNDLVRDLDRLLAEVERPDAKYLAESVDVILQPILADLADHSVSSAEIPAALVVALAPRYTILQLLGRGGMATVYLAFDSTLGRHVAIKCLRPELADGMGVERFEREIAIAATADHPHIVPVYDRGNAGSLLYYVMRYVEGGSLRDLLLERPQLEIRKAIDIARDVAAALDAAHAKKIVHRDIKPANILLDEHGAHLADFGVARLIDAAGREHLTRTGIALGTALYMSPEQAGSATKVDGRSDVYALACVLYEMLAGEAPFTGPTQRDIMAKHLAAVIPDLTVVRATISRPMQRVMATALQKSPADRFSTAGAFVDAFERAWLAPDEDANASVDIRETRAPDADVAARRNRVRVRVATLTTLGVLLLGLGSWRLSLGMRAAPLEADLHVVFPFVMSGDVQLDVAQRLREAMAKWTGIRVVDQFTLDSKLGSSRNSGLTDRQATTTARSLGARRFIRGSVQPEGEFVRIAATLFDVDSGPLAEVPARVRSDFGETDSLMAALAERLLFRNVPIDRRVEASIGTTNYAARQSYLVAQAAIREWDLAKADSALFRAIKLDATYSQSLVWLAHVRFWREEPPSRWRDYVERAIVGQLSVREHNIALALQQWADNKVLESCATWERLTDEDQGDGLLWYSAYKCRFRDDVVVRDPASPTNWRFRSSHHLALTQLERALRLAPVIFRGLRDNGFEQLRGVLKTNAGSMRQGRIEGLGPGFAAYPMISNDTLAFVPIPWGALGSEPDAAARFRSMIGRAFVRQRLLFRDWATSWASNNPQSAEAWEAVAVALESLGDETALDTIARARRLVRNPAEQQRISATQAWLLVKFSLPSNLEGLRHARMLADSVLQYPVPSPVDRQLLASLAALTGRLSLALEHARFLPDWPRRGAPASVNEAGAHLLLQAALGGPVRELTALERKADSVIRLAADFERIAARKDIIGRAAALAFPAYLMSTLQDSTFSDDLLFRSLQQWQRDDKEGVAATLGVLRTSRRHIPRANVQFDKLLPEARLIELMYGVREAEQWIDPTLALLRGVSHQNLLDPIRAASLVGTMAFRADLASRSGDRATAALWGAAVAELWADCDPVLCPVRDRMRALTR